MNKYMYVQQCAYIHIIICPFNCVVILKCVLSKINIISIATAATKDHGLILLMGV